MKVNVPVASSLKKYKHDLSHDVSTTSDIGFMQPLMVREFPAKSTINFRAAQVARLQPIAKPTFGSLSLKDYNVFVPIASIFHPYDSLRSGQTYRGSEARYIPKIVPFVTNAFWNGLCKLLSTVQVWEGQSGSVTIVNGDEVKVSAGSLSLVDDAQVFATVVDDIWLEGNTIGEDNNADEVFLITLREAFRYGIQDISYPFMDTDVEGIAEFGDDMGYDWIEVLSQPTADYVICGRFNLAARNLRKILYGCGYKLNDSLTNRSFLPVMAYYKAWFDLFAPQRDVTWKDTACAGLQEWMEQNGNFNIADIISVQGPERLFTQFIKDLCSCYFTQSPDFVSAHITGQRIGATPNYTYFYLNSSETSLASTTPNEDVSTLNRQSATFDLSSNSSTTLRNVLTAQGIELLMRVAKRNNAHTPLGGRIREILKMITGADYLEEDESYWIGSQSLDIVINPIFNTAETSEGFLGEYRGEGSAGSPGQQFHYENKVDGFWVCLCAVVPDAKFAQGTDMMLKHLTKEDFWDPLYDSQTLLPTHQDYIFGENQLTVAGSEDRYDKSFGNVPCQIEYCIAQNVVNGDMSLMSSRASFLPFTLDKLLPYTQFYKDDSGNYVIKSVDNDLLVNGTIWRYIGLNKWIGNYDRIFVNEGEEGKIAYINQDWDHLFEIKAISDNIILHNCLFCEYYHMKLPVRDSYNTGAFDKDSMTVEMA